RAVAARRLGTAGEDLVEPLDLADPERGRDVAQAVVEAEAHMLEPAPGLGPALVSERAHQVPLLLGVGDHHPAFAGRELLVRVEGEDARGTAGSDGRPAVFGAERLAGVVDQGEAVAIGDRPQL